MNNKSNKNSINYNKVIKTIGFIAFFYAFFALYKALYENYTISQKVKNLEAEVLILQQKNKEVESLNAYYQTDSFKEKEARARLSLARPGETILIIPGQKEEEIKQIENDKKIPKTNWDLWYEYFF